MSTDRSPGNGEKQVPLADRVRQRVSAAHDAALRRSGPPSPNTGLSREVIALRSVFKDFGKLHRQYRERTGQKTSPALRAAALAFKQEPSLISLVAVAGFLDDLELLPR